MSRAAVLFLAGLVVLGGCKKKTADMSQLDNVPTNFVQVDFDEEDKNMEEMFGTELMRATAECGDLVKLEPSAMMGKLKDAEIRCIDDRLKVSEKQTIKDKLSRVLMNDAWAKGDLHRWEFTVRRHLETIDRSDPDLVYRFTSHLSKKSAEFADETLRWSDVALENRSFWQGDTHVKRVFDLYRMKALAAQKKWISLEEDLLKAPSDDLRKTVDEARNQTKTYSREWLEYARQAGRDPTMAMQLCVSAAGTQGFCEGAPGSAGGQ